MEAKLKMMLVILFREKASVDFQPGENPAFIWYWPWLILLLESFWWWHENRSAKHTCELPLTSAAVELEVETDRQKPLSCCQLGFEILDPHHSTPKVFFFVRFLVRKIHWNSLFVWKVFEIGFKFESKQERLPPLESEILLLQGKRCY